MKVNFFLHSEAFEYNGKDSECTVVKKFKLLLDDFSDIVYEYGDENVFKTSNNLISNCKIYKQEGLMDFINKHLDHDECALFYSILTDISDDYDLCYEELKKMCTYKKDETEINSLLVINYYEDSSEEDIKLPYITFDKYMVVYSKDSWITLRRQILGNHPGKPDYYINEAKKYFSNITFHENCIKSLEQDNYLDIIPRKITLYLSCLNDKFYIIRNQYKENSDRNDILRDFSGQCNLDEPASLEGNIKKKKSMTFKFKVKSKIENQEKILEISCEPHLKISQQDANYKGSIDYKKFHPRIYFAFDVKEFKNHIFIGSIGPHL